MTTSKRSKDPRVQAVLTDFGGRRARFFMTFAMIEGAVLAVAVLAVYVLDLIDPEIGIWVILAVALLGATVVTFGLMSLMRAQQRAVREAQGLF